MNYRRAEGHTNYQAHHDVSTTPQLRHVYFWTYALESPARKETPLIYMKTPTTPFTRPPPPPLGTLEQRTDSNGPLYELREELEQDPLGHGEPLSVETQVAVGLYWLGHGSTFVNLAHVFSIGKETADKASGPTYKGNFESRRPEPVRPY
ncbi:uncharacterized protein VP01_1365g3 [Puccinia sorghi]|uniref:Uncharacterized protein n=1 Tax=Puccinia sorghi TaxID=27349 RepID=A0A0L6VLU2_9BASI|nr:uncharacterized protein VP01_1365g3 [Puccinia sorghi]